MRSKWRIVKDVDGWTAIAPKGWPPTATKTFEGWEWANAWVRVMTEFEKKIRERGA